MRNVAWFVPISALALTGCADKQTVDKPAADVLTTLSSLPTEANAMRLATQYPGTSFYAEPAADKVVWHFVRASTGEYGRYVAEISEEGPNKTTVSTHFEDGPADQNLTFLDKVAKIAADASVTAALNGQSVDRSTVQSQIASEMARDPLAAQTAVIETVADEMQRQAPPDRCKVGTPEEQSSWVCQKHGRDVTVDSR